MVRLYTSRQFPASLASQSTDKHSCLLWYDVQAYAFLGERWGPLGWVGAAVILVASITTQLGGAVSDDDNNTDKQKEATS